MNNFHLVFKFDFLLFIGFIADSIIFTHLSNHTKYLIENLFFSHY